MDINARLAKLERENRRMKKIGIVAVVFASVLFISGQAKTNKVVEANEFRLVDDSGKVRANLFSIAGPHLYFYDEAGIPVVTLSATSLSPASLRPSLTLGKIGTRESASLDAGETALPSPSPSLSLGGTGPDSRVLLSGGGVTALSMLGSGGSLRVDVDGHPGGASVTVNDKERYSGVFGRSDLVLARPGKKERTPAASVVLFDKDMKVLWSAP